MLACYIPDKKSNNVADDHKVHVLTRSKSQARVVFPGKKVNDLLHFFLFENYHLSS